MMNTRQAVLPFPLSFHSDWPADRRSISPLSSETTIDKVSDRSTENSETHWEAAKRSACSLLAFNWWGRRSAVFGVSACATVHGGKTGTLCYSLKRYGRSVFKSRPSPDRSTAELSLWINNVWVTQTCLWLQCDANKQLVLLYLGGLKHPHPVINITSSDASPCKLKSLFLHFRSL